MKALGLYAATAALAIAAVVVGFWFFFDEVGRRSLLMGASVAWVVQLGAFALLTRARSQPGSFFLLWGVGALGRMAVVVVVGLGMDRFEGVEPSVLILSLVGFLFLSLLIEPLFFDRTRETAPIAQ
ncbi:MAG: hypothetical protein OEZ65_11850 [Gemmatimonadota bacterium]|nr:hypothetical protein [Gemmatimonadota bacterium]MDH5760275.1 hypothetical protein [Gemmatimonadota bacterium]